MHGNGRGAPKEVSANVLGALVDRTQSSEPRRDCLPERLLSTIKGFVVLHAVSTTVLESGMIKWAAWWANTCPIVWQRIAGSARTTIFSDYDYYSSESTIEIRATVPGGHLVIDHPYAILICPEVPY